MDPGHLTEYPSKAQIRKQLHCINCQKIQLPLTSPSSIQVCKQSALLHYHLPLWGFVGEAKEVPSWHGGTDKTPLWGIFNPVVVTDQVDVFL